ncbi:hypothetical protein B0J14DRAFT_563631 [Halenospora varia]|nr:hypothetical protein B0J14DRAFT_563631 [Halenospora varia]
MIFQHLIHEPGLDFLDENSDVFVSWADAAVSRAKCTTISRLIRSYNRYHPISSIFSTQSIVTTLCPSALEVRLVFFPPHVHTVELIQFQDVHTFRVEDNMQYGASPVENLYLTNCSAGELPLTEAFMSSTEAYRELPPMLEKLEVHHNQTKRVCFLGSQPNCVIILLGMKPTHAMTKLKKIDILTPEVPEWPDHPTQSRFILNPNGTTPTEYELEKIWAYYGLNNLKTRAETMGIELNITLGYQPPTNSLQQSTYNVHREEESPTSFNK